MMEQIDPNGRSTVLIHFVCQTSPERIACMPRMEEMHKTKYHSHHQRTNSTGAVTCPACKLTDIFKTRSSRGG